VCGSAYSLSRSTRCRSPSLPHGSRFGSPVVLSRVHWVRPEMVVEVSYVGFTPDGLLRHVVYLGEREDKAASHVIRDQP
jgi:ATP-dependent DNA ligase